MLKYIKKEKRDKMDYDVLKKWTEELKKKLSLSISTEADLYYEDSSTYKLKFNDSLYFIRFEEICDLIVVTIDIDSVMENIERKYIFPKRKKKKWIKMFACMTKELGKKRKAKAVIIQGYEDFEKGEEITKYFQKTNFKRLKGRKVHFQLFNTWIKAGVYYEIERKFLRTLLQYLKMMEKTIKEKGDITTKTYGRFFRKDKRIDALSYPISFEGKEREILAEKKENELVLYEKSERPTYYPIDNQADIQRAMEEILEKIKQRERIKQIIHPNREEFDRRTNGLSKELQEAIYNELRQTLSPKEIQVDCMTYPQEYINIKEKGFQLNGWSIVKCKNKVYIEDEERKIHILTEEEAKIKLEEKNEEIIKRVKEESWNKIKERIKGLG